MVVDEALKVGDLVRAAYPPVGYKEDIDLDCLGVVHKIYKDHVVVSWPNVGLLSFRYFDLESVDV